MDAHRAASHAAQYPVPPDDEPLQKSYTNARASGFLAVSATSLFSGGGSGLLLQNSERGERDASVPTAPSQLPATAPAIATTCLSRPAGVGMLLQGATQRVLESLPAADLDRLVDHRFVAPSDLGRALGRVLAHEIGHVILAVRCHKRRGLVRPAFLAADLVTHDRQFYGLSDSELTRLRGRELKLKLDAQSSASDAASSQTIVP